MSNAPGAEQTSEGVSLSDEADDVRNLEETAAFYSLSKPTLKRYIEIENCPVLARGDRGVGYRMSLRQVGDWLQARREAEAAERERKARQTAQLQIEILGEPLAPADAPAVLSPKERAEAYKAELDRAKLAQLRGELVRADEVQLNLARVLAGLKTRLRRMPDVLAPRLGWSEDEIAAALEAIDEVLDDTADELAGMLQGGGDADK